MKLLVRIALAFIAIWSAADGLAGQATTALSVPIVFEENRGQAPSAYSYVFHHGLTALFAPGGIDFMLPTRHGSADRLRLDFLDAAPHPAFTAGKRLKGQSNYLLGSKPSGFMTQIAQYGAIHYGELYPGVQLDFYGNGAELEHDFTLSPHADPAGITLHFQGALDERVTAAGDLLVETREGSLILKRPVAYQDNGGHRTEIDAAFQQRSNGGVGFHLGRYDAGRPLIIDPVLSFSTYLDGEYSDQIAAVTTDSSGNIYVTGTTGSPDFPIESAEQSQLGCSSSSSGSCANAFITKLDPTGKTLLYSTYIGGSGQDQGASIVVDASGNAVIGGVSSSPNFPNAGLLQTSCQINNSCYFLASLKPDGSALNYSGLIGGAEGLYSNGMNGRLALDASGNAYLAGTTDDADFVITPGTLAASVPGYPDNSTFVLKVGPTGQLIYSTIIPGTAAPNPAQVYNNWFLPYAITVDDAGQVTVAGTGGTGLPTTSGTAGPTFPNPTADVESPTAGYLLQLNAAASAINFGSYVPGTDQLEGMAVDSSGNIYVTGETYRSTLPVSSNAYQATPALDRDGSIATGYVAKLSPGAASVSAATYLDGTTPSLNNGTNFQALALDSSGNVLLGGTTGSSDFPMLDPFVAEFETGTFDVDMVLAELSGDLTTLRFGSFLSSVDGSFPGAQFSGFAIDPTGHVLVTGTTLASDFPTTAGSFMRTPPASPNSNIGYIHSFLARLDMGAAAPSVCPASWSVSLGTVTALTSSQKSFNITNCGNAPLNLGSITSSASTLSAAQTCTSVAPGATCPVTITFAPVNAALSSGTLTLTDNAAIPTQVIQVSGQGSAPDLEPSPNSLSLGHLLAGTSGPQQSLLLFNRGNASLVIGSISLSGSGFTLQQSQCVTSISAGSACPIFVDFAPPSAGSFTASINIHSNDPVHPLLAIPLTGAGDSTYATPAVTEIAEPTNLYPLQTIQVQSGTSQQIILYGSNFYPQSVVQFNGSAQATTFVSNSELRAMVAASSLTTLGDLPFSVANPSPGGGSSATSTLTGYQFLPFANINALASVPSAGQLYVAISAIDTVDPNTILPINAAAGTTGTPIPVGKNPVYLAPSSDGSYLWVANAGDSTLQRINLQTQSVDKTFAYAPDHSCSSCSPPAATDLKSIPGSPTEVVLAQGGQVALYNDSGLVNYAPNVFVSYFTPSFTSITFAGSPLALYAQPFTSVQNPFFNTVAITGSGLQYTSMTGTNYGPPAGIGSEVASDGTLLYTDSGEVWNPSTQKQTGTFGASLTYDEPGDILIDTALGSIYLAGFQSLNRPNSGGAYSALAVDSFGQNSLARGPALTFPLIDSAESFDLTRWGSNGFAFAVPVPYAGSSGVYIFRSNALANAAANNPVPAIGSIAPADTVAGSSAFTLTVDGTGFLASSIVSWNSSPLTTSYGSATQLTASVPASLVAAAGTTQITVTSPAPGGGSSPAVAFTITAAAPAASLSATTLSFGSILEGSSSAPQTVTLSNTGTAALAIASVTATSSYSQTTDCPATLAAGATCHISVTFAPTASGTLPGSVTLATNASGSPQTITLSGSGTPPVSITAGGGNSTSQTVTSGGTATYNLSLAGSSGFSGSVALSCSGAPQYATCSVTPSSVTLASGGTSSFTVTVATRSSALAVAASDRIQKALAGFGAAAFLLLPLSRCIRKGTLLASLLLLTASCLMLPITGCGGGAAQNSSVPPSTPRGTYTLTVTAAAQGASIQQRLTMVVD